MKDWKISMPDGWEPGNCEVCPCECFAEGPTDCSLIKAVPVEVEPLAVLADRKGYYISRIDGNGEDSHRWEIGMFQFTEEGEEVNWKGFEAPTYAECEAKARAYLNGLPDAAGKGDN